MKIFETKKMKTLEKMNIWEKMKTLEKMNIWEKMKT